MTNSTAKITRAILLSKILIVCGGPSFDGIKTVTNNVKQDESKYNFNLLQLRFDSGFTRHYVSYSKLM